MVVGVDKIHDHFRFLPAVVFFFVVMTGEGSLCFLAGLGLSVPLHGELDEVVLTLLLSLGKGEEHVVVCDVIAIASFCLVVQNYPCGALIAIILREALIPHVLVPETCHAVIIKAFEWFVLSVLGALAWL